MERVTAALVVFSKLFFFLYIFLTRPEGEKKSFLNRPLLSALSQASLLLFHSNNRIEGDFTPVSCVFF